jgi:hypothetical protein
MSSSVSAINFKKSGSGSRHRRPSSFEEKSPQTQRHPVAAAAAAVSEQEQVFVKPSLCIPRTFKNISQKRVFAVFKALNLGWIGRIDVVPKTASDGTEYVRIFVHFTRWFDTFVTNEFLDKINVPTGSAKIVYEDPWFWNVVASAVPCPPTIREETATTTTQRQHTKPRLEYSTTTASKKSASS